MKSSKLRLACLLFIAAAWTLTSSGCRTFRGFGQDVQHTGHHIQRAAS